MRANVIDAHIEDLRKTWGYTTEELNDIREKLEEVFNDGFFVGRDYNVDPHSLHSYGKKEDWD